MRWSALVLIFGSARQYSLSAARVIIEPTCKQIVVHLHTSMFLNIHHALPRFVPMLRSACVSQAVDSGPPPLFQFTPSCAYTHSHSEVLVRRLEIKKRPYYMYHLHVCHLYEFNRLRAFRQAKDRSEGGSVKFEVSRSKVEGFGL